MPQPGRGAVFRCCSKYWPAAVYDLLCLLAGHRRLQGAGPSPFRLEPLPEGHPFPHPVECLLPVCTAQIDCAIAEAAAFSCGQNQARWPSLSLQLPTYPHTFAYREVIYPAGTGGMWRGWDG
jgi:hypothetical protein